MLTTNALSVFPTHKQFEQALGLSVGFETMFDRLFECNQQNQSKGYPPYNLKKDGDHYIIELAVAGLGENDIKVHVEDRVFTASKKIIFIKVSPGARLKDLGLYLMI